MIDSRVFFSQKSSVHFHGMQDAFIKLQRIVVMKLKRVSQLTLGLFFCRPIVLHSASSISKKSTTTEYHDYFGR